MTVDVAAIIRAELHLSPETWSIRRGRVCTAGDATSDWVVASPGSAELPTGGWKLHVAASEWSLAEVLHRSLPVIMRHRVAFKAAPVELLADLNSGRCGVSQIGKFLTIYPALDCDIATLAAELHTATAGLRGPLPPSDRPLSPTGVVSYRHGSFSGGFMQTPIGTVVPASADGVPVADVRTPYYRAPEGVLDPLLSSCSGEHAVGDELLDGRYLLLTCLSRTVRGAVYEAVDVPTAQPCIVKHAPKDRMVDAAGVDARSRLRHEADVLSALAPDTRFPRCRALISWHDDLCLVEDHMGGTSLEAAIATLSAAGEWVGRNRFLRWAAQLLSMLQKIEADGWIYSDLKSTNVRVVDDALRLIDFEDCVTTGTEYLRGTRGYFADEPHGPTSAARRHLFGLGALLYFLLTGAEPSRKPDGPLLRRKIEWLNPDAEPDLCGFVQRCLADTREGFSTLRAAVEELNRLHLNSSRSAPPRATGAASEDQIADVVRRIGDSICAAAKPVPGGAAWASPDDPTGRAALRDVNSGSAGVVLALADIVHALHTPRHADVLGSAASALLRRREFSGAPLPGLYVGEAGVGAALLRAGQVLGDASLIDAAAAQGQLVAGMPHRSPDVFNGTAGRLRFHLLLWNATGDDDHRMAAMKSVDALLEPCCEDTFNGWRYPDGYETLSGQAQFGYAHGVAGIADCLLDAHAAFADDRIMPVVRDAAALLIRKAITLRRPSGAIAWPIQIGDEQPHPPLWCHGAGGIAKFLCRLSTVDGNDRSRAAAVAAGKAIALGARWAGPTQCHGLAGNIETLLDLFTATADEHWLDSARSLYRILMASSSEDRGHLVWSTDDSERPFPGLMTGYGGIASCLLRLAEPAHQRSILEWRDMSASSSGRPVAV